MWLLQKSMQKEKGGGAKILSLLSLSTHQLKTICEEHMYPLMLSFFYGLVDFSNFSQVFQNIFVKVETLTLKFHSAKTERPRGNREYNK